jgi:hypothetical protein
MRILTLTVILLSFFFNAKSQSNCDCYERLSGMARLKYHEGQIDSALIIYKKAFSFLPEESKSKFNYILLSQYYSANQMIDSAVYYAEKAIINGYNPDYLLKKQDFEPLINSEYWENLKNLKPNLNNFNWEYYNSLKEMLGVDQAIRNEDILGKWANDSIYYVVDSVNFYALKELINEYGLPSVPSHGFHFNEILTFLMHSSVYSEEKFKEVLNILQEANDNCLINKGFIATFIDRRKMWIENEKQVTGSWNNSKGFNPISDLSNVDSLRFNFNLLNLEDYAKMRGFKVPDGYLKSNYPKNYFCK